MKKKMKQIAFFLMGAMMLGSFSSCEVDGPHLNDIVEYQSTMNSGNTTPRATSSAQGSASFEYNKETKTLTYNITYQGLTPQAVRIHRAQPAWEVGPPVFTLPNHSTSPLTGTIKLTQDQENLLRLGNLYINVPTSQFPFGEIRGQILPVPFGE